MGSNWTNIIWLLLVLGVPAISWIVGKVREQQEIAKARDEMRRRREQSLRQTTVASREEPPAAAGQPRTQSRADALRDLAARRQAQLREMRDRQRRSQTQQPAQSRAPVQQPTAPQRPSQVSRPGVPGRPTRPPTVARAPGTTQPSVRRRQQTQTRPQQPQRRQAQQRPAPGPPRQQTQRRIPEVAPPAPELPARRKRGSSVADDVHRLFARARGDHRDLARFIAISEAFSKPIAMRDESDMPWNRSLG